MREENVRYPIENKATAAIGAGHLLHPSRHFDHPRDVLAAKDIGKEEKRAILASWAYDIYPTELIPALRLYPGTDKAVAGNRLILESGIHKLQERASTVDTGCTTVSFGSLFRQRRRN